MRQDQDQEYEAALEADRQRVEAAAQESERKDAEKAAEAEEKELAEAVELSRQLSRESDVERKKKRLEEEPPAGPNATNLRINVPSGSRLQRRFLSSATLQVRTGE